jgi:hypothetical protein
METEVLSHPRGSRFFCRAPGGMMFEINTRSALDAVGPVAQAVSLAALPRRHCGLAEPAGGEPVNSAGLGTRRSALWN